MKDQITNTWIGLTSENVNSLLGKTIKWKAPAASENEGYGGKFQINEVLFDGKVKGIVIMGDDLKFAYPDKDGYCYSDDDRFVTYQILD